MVNLSLTDLLSSDAFSGNWLSTKITTEERKLLRGHIFAGSSAKTTRIT
jgi:hypothetical protein